MGVALGEALTEVLGDAESGTGDFVLTSGLGTVLLMLWPGTTLRTSIIFTGPAWPGGSLVAMAVPLTRAFAPGWPMAIGVGLSTEISAELPRFEPLMLVVVTPIVMTTAIGPSRVHITRELTRHHLMTSVLDSDRAVPLESKSAISGFGAATRTDIALSGGSTGEVATAG